MTGGILDGPTLSRLLAEVKTIAVVGAKDTPGQPVDRVGRYLIGNGFRVLPVHPVRKVVWGIPAFQALTDIEEPVDLVDVFRAPQHCPAHARECLEMRTLPRIFWMQSGIRSQEAKDILAGRPITVVEDSCLMVEHARIFGSR